MTAALRIRPMSKDEFGDWVENQVVVYAEEVAAARGIPLETARKMAEDDHRRYLPDGVDTAGMHLLVGEDESGERIGILWVGPNPAGSGPAWVYDIEVVDGRRGEGWGRALMVEAERVARSDGHGDIGLNVFASNQVAHHLYESLGYAPSSIQMRKPLG